MHKQTHQKEKLTVDAKESVIVVYQGHVAVGLDFIVSLTNFAFFSSSFLFNMWLMNIYEVVIHGALVIFFVMFLLALNLVVFNK